MGETEGDDETTVVGVGASESDSCTDELTKIEYAKEPVKTETKTITVSATAVNVLFVSLTIEVMVQDTYYSPQRTPRSQRRTPYKFQCLRFFRYTTATEATATTTTAAVARNISL